MKKLAILLFITAIFISVPFLLMAETNEIIILLKDSDKYFNERNFNKYLEVNKKLFSKNKNSIPKLIEANCKLLFETYLRMTTEIGLQGKIDENTNFIKIHEELKFINQPKKYEDKEFNELASQAFSESAIIYDNNNNIIECCEAIASYKLQKVIQELKNSTSIKVYFEKQNKWLYQYDISTKENEILIAGLLLSNEYRDWRSNALFKIKIDFNFNSKTYQMLLGHENQYYIKELPTCEGDYSVKNNKVFSDIILNYSIFNNDNIYSLNLDSDYLKTLPLSTQEIVCKLKMKYINTDQDNEYCPIFQNEKYSYSNSSSTIEVICPKHGKIVHKRY